MNWTEGNLARHSRGRQRKELLTRQRQHFAKARNNLLNSNAKHSPIAISFLSRDAVSASRADHRPLLSSSPLLSKRPLQDLHPADAKSPTPTREKRRRLLDKPDWTGLGSQQPLDITFLAHSHSAGGSRWRKVDRPLEQRPGRVREPVQARRAEASKPVERPPRMRIQIGSQEIQPSIRTASQASIRRYSLAPPSLRGSRSKKSPSQGQHRHRSVASGSSPQTRVSKYSPYGERPTQGNAIQPFYAPSARAETPAHVAYASSIMHEPAPRRADDFLVLQWSPSSSEARSSLQVEIERPARPVPPDQEADNRKWMNWLPSSSVVCSSSPLFLSSGSSSRHRQTANSLEHASIMTSSDSAMLPSHLQMRLPSLEVPSENRHTPEQRPEERAVNPLPPPNGNQQGRQSATDLDSIWKQFVFNDDDSDEVLRDAFKEAAHQAAVELRPSDTSDSITGAPETAATCGSEPNGSDELTFVEPVLVSPNASVAATKGTAASEPISTSLPTSSSSAVEQPEGASRFAFPKAFVGKRSTEHGGTMGGHAAVTVGQNEKKRGKLKKKKKASDGRWDIRALPDFDEDPIED
ncbi:hypothetical protein F4780DRAFT_592524 [Xylariomycetidae sp. FL0641]|nr:hypothetical protein F4780DRAFT_592524 [Xylariomycetidae sp. FL0641]